MSVQARFSIDHGLHKLQRKLICRIKTQMRKLNTKKKPNKDKQRKIIYRIPTRKHDLLPPVAKK